MTIKHICKVNHGRMRETERERDRKGETEIGKETERGK